MLGQYLPLSTYHLPSAPILTAPIQNFPSVWLKRLWKSSAAGSPSGGMKDVFFPAGQSVINRKLPKEKTTNNSQ
jgi:hypothetical protein